MTSFVEHYTLLLQRDMDGCQKAIDKTKYYLNLNVHILIVVENHTRMY